MLILTHCHNTLATGREGGGGRVLGRGGSAAGAGRLRRCHPPRRSSLALRLSSPRQHRPWHRRRSRWDDEDGGGGGGGDGDDDS
eukprot:2289998-Rhodomonas_salina.1